MLKGCASHVGLVYVTKNSVRNERIYSREGTCATERYQWDKMHIARFYWEENQWKVYARDEQSSWNPVDVITPCSDFENVLEQVERDEAGLFWRT
ncbi:DUF3024 domain-containing protein [Paenibacillus sp. FSL K6-1122]|uniref:DUF3024 domain-containing protein n=1 Tax=Paenibacillus sp. FSL K6-1122 TaxID=2954512 RepID=UPI0030EF118C